MQTILSGRRKGKKIKMLLSKDYVNKTRSSVLMRDIDRGWRGVNFNGELITLVNISLLCLFQSDYMVYAHLFLFKSDISLCELKGFRTKKTGDINCFINWLCIPIVIKVSPLVENLFSNCVSTDVKYSSQNTIGLTETGNRISLSLVRFY